MTFKKTTIFSLLILSAAFVAFRIFSAFHSNAFVDFRAYYDTTWAISRGENPFLLSSLRVWNWAEPPICYPGAAIFFAPFLLFGINTATHVFFFLNLSAGILLFIVVFNKFGLIELKAGKLDMLKTGNIMVLLSLFLFIVSAPFMACLRHGQIGAIASLLVCLFIFGYGKTADTVTLGVSAIVKYSMITVFAPALFIRKNFFACIAGLIIFLLAGLSPLIFGCDIAAVYKSYFSELQKQTTTGFNTYSFSGYNMLHAEFLKYQILCTAIKLFVLIAAFTVIFRSRNRNWKLMELVLLSATTMIISYHRLYDLVFLLPFMLAAANDYWRKQDHSKAGTLFLFSFALLIPENIVYRLAGTIGSSIGENSIFYLSQFGEFKQILPLYPALILIIFIYSLTIIGDLHNEKK